MNNVRWLWHYSMALEQRDLHETGKHPDPLNFYKAPKMSRVGMPTNPIQ